MVQQWYVSRDQVYLCSNRRQRPVEPLEARAQRTSQLLAETQG
eukprot:SAG31_NODE_1689_length_7525_cov_3.264745_4_plen_43_part_00